ncbi:MAG: DNA mismatch repair protein MutS [Clostridiaceae bacterium]|nr:DNA mismatch repair protein MutS [Clostridiaceae bacterium]
MTGGYQVSKPLVLADVDKDKLTPMMQQFVEQKSKAGEALLFFRLGDFYELFFDDALIASRICEIALTGRDCGLEERAPMCGVPYHAATGYINKLLAANYKVAICEQIEDPATAQGLVERGIIRIITPGTRLDEEGLPARQNNYLVSIYKSLQYYGLSYTDITTGEFYGTSFVLGNPEMDLLSELARLRPVEIVSNSSEVRDLLTANLPQQQDVTFNLRDEAGFVPSENSSAYYPKKYQQPALWPQAASGLLSYLTETTGVIPKNLRELKEYSVSSYMRLNPTTRRNLELTRNIHSGSTRGSLIGVIDYTQTAMGARVLRSYINQPLVNLSALHDRQNAVAALVEDYTARMSLLELLDDVYDLERLNAKLAQGRVNPRDLLALAASLRLLPAILEHLSAFTANSTLLAALSSQIDPHNECLQRIESAIDPDAPINISEGGIIREGYSEEIDALRSAKLNGQDWLIALEGRERERTGIRNLKIGYNRVFGYYIEVSRGNLSLVPEYYQRRQTLVNSERFITEELKSMENTILGAQARLDSAEYQAFCGIRDEIAAHVTELLQTARALAQLDALISLAEASQRNNWVRPELNEDKIIDITDGEHPVVADVLGPGRFVTNDTYLDGGDNRLLILTGPNMSGKSTYMRQVALIVLLAQIGCFVPAKRAVIGLADAIYTRIGAADDIASGRSTFMMEMSELAEIISDATDRSLLLLDEIGRGTGTIDGLAIAQASLEYISQAEHLRARTLFATHFHELVDLAARIPGIVNYHVQVDRRGEEMVFLHRLAKGGTDDSFGIEVAALAGLPDSLIMRAREHLANIEDQRAELTQRRSRRRKSAPMESRQERNLFEASLALKRNDEIIDCLRAVDVNAITPLDALRILDELSKLARGE